MKARVNKKLSLKKRTVSDLSQAQQGVILGGHSDICPLPTETRKFCTNNCFTYNEDVSCLPTCFGSCGITCMDSCKVSLCPDGVSCVC